MLRKRSGESVDPPAQDDSALADHVTKAKAEIDRLVQLGELQGDPLRHPIQALSVHLDALHNVAVSFNRTAQRADPAMLTSNQIDDIGRRLMGGCQGWARSFVRTSYWRSQAVLAMVVLSSVAAGFGAGWWMHSPPTELACADQADGARLCWMYTRLPTAVTSRR